ncbi:hypothetical protein GSI_09676 [Ganoderma sinense ZZ0214-1]|uniref:GST N-terminal domain-containing protein n=1 Tax=Ganoderma sinense ZZ0214-1 TaxID=1077348 RepID=A0A2G8S3D7_9APHY|nr:hypothetical protein GSI_09676 [Ganoderma sinense ZZ0214-1]
MVQNGQITFYTHMYSPNCHRVHIALEEVKADYTPVTVNLMEKPEWYNQKVNPITGKIPAITYGGPKHAPEVPSGEATSLIESMVIVEFLGELFPAANLVPRDPLLRAKARIFTSVVETKLLEGLRSHFFMGGPASELIAAFEALQALLPPAGGFAVGEWSTADIAAAPYLVRILMLLKHDIGKYPVGEGKKTMEVLRGPKFARIMQYVEDAKAWPSFRATWDEAATLEIWKTNPAIQRN